MLCVVGSGLGTFSSVSGSSDKHSGKASERRPFLGLGRSCTNLPDSVCGWGREEDTGNDVLGSGNSMNKGRNGYVWLEAGEGVWGG